MKRPSFQFYPDDWLGDANLRRCTHAERGVWMDVLCLMHQSEEYGVLRWPLKDIAQAVGAKVADLNALAAKGVLRGSDAGTVQAMVYRPRSARKLGEPVTLVAEQAGPVWYSKRMVTDEYVRTIRGESSRFSAGNDDAPKVAPKPPFSDGASSSSSSSKKKHSPAESPKFAEFWLAYPLKVNKAQAAKAWDTGKHDGHADTLIADVARRAREHRPWLEGFIPHASTYLRNARWDDEIEPPHAPKPAMAPVRQLRQL